MKKIFLAIVAIIFTASIVKAERYVMVTHTQGTDPFWPVVQKGGEDAARAIGAQFEYKSVAYGSLPKKDDRTLSKSPVAIDFRKLRDGKTLEESET